MNYRKATLKDASAVTDVVQNTKAAVFPKYYPSEVVDFFADLHCYEHVEGDIKEGNVFVLLDNDIIVGTGSYKDNHITRVYVLPECQGKGYGTYILEQLEKDIWLKCNEIELDSSLPACKFYEKHGYRTIRHEEWQCKNDVVLVYDIMRKEDKSNGQ